LGKKHELPQSLILVSFFRFDTKIGFVNVKKSSLEFFFWRSLSKFRRPDFRVCVREVKNPASNRSMRLALMMSQVMEGLRENPIPIPRFVRVFFYNFYDELAPLLLEIILCFYQ
jgi:hypothetical protein